MFVARCTAQLAVAVDGEQVATEPDVDCFHPTS
jgi:hypothetical protein